MIDPEKCHHREQLEDPGYPFKRASHGAGFVLLQFSDSGRREFPVSFCIVCGGHLDGTITTADESNTICPCMRQHAAEALAPVTWDARFEEFTCKIREPGGRTTFRIYFCPWCGTKLPEGRRAEFFTKMSEEDILKIGNQLAGSKTVADVQERIGKPDRILPGYKAEELPLRIPGLRSTRQSLDYFNLSPNVALQVQEFEDGSIRWGFSGKYIGPPLNDQS